jgi:hypothetical protein
MRANTAVGTVIAKLKTWQNTQLQKSCLLAANWQDVCDVYTLCTRHDMAAGLTHLHQEESIPASALFYNKHNISVHRTGTLFLLTEACNTAEKAVSSLISSKLPA